jgi:hypothetical protein
MDEPRLVLPRGGIAQQVGLAFQESAAQLDTEALSSKGKQATNEATWWLITYSLS